MGRGENEDVSNLNLPDPQSTERTYFGKSGEEIAEKEGFAMVSEVDKTKSYYILYNRAEIIDAYNDRLSRSSSTTRKFKKVSKDCFDFYMKYLKTRNTLYFTRARRTMTEK